jgi:hypothetical protein
MAPNIVEMSEIFTNRRRKLYSVTEILYSNAISYNIKALNFILKSYIV